MPSVLPIEMMTPVPNKEEELIEEEPPEPVNEEEIFSKKEVKKNTSSEKETSKAVEDKVHIEKIEKQESKVELEMLITEESEKPKKNKKRGKATKSPEELAEHMSKMRAASLRKRKENKIKKELLKKKTENDMFDKPSSPLSTAIQSSFNSNLRQEKVVKIPKPSSPINIPSKQSSHCKAEQSSYVSIEEKLRLAELKIFELNVREDERTKIKNNNESKAKQIAQSNLQQPNRFGRKSAMSKWTQPSTYTSNDPFDVYKIN
jgi:hypothetical protein